MDVKLATEKLDKFTKETLNEFRNRIKNLDDSSLNQEFDKLISKSFKPKESEEPVTNS